MLELGQAMKAARRTLRAHMPDEKFSLTALKDPTRAHADWVFRCRARTSPLVLTCKLTEADAAGQARMQHQFQRLQVVSAQMTDPAFGTPQPIAFNNRHAALLMSDLAGESLADLLSRLSGPPLLDHLLRAGRWIAAFQRPTRRITDFAHKPHSNSLTRKLVGGMAAVACPEAFQAALAPLADLAKAAQGQPGLRCVSHRDLHSANLIFAPDGAVHGIDFENDREDEALRDPVSLLADALSRLPQVPDAGMIRTAAAALWQGYDDTASSADVTAYFLRFAALNAWANLGPQHLLSPYRRRKLVVLQHLVTMPVPGSA